MKRILIATLIVLLATVPGYADQSTDEQAAQLRRGNVKFWLGVCLAGAGAFVLPITNTGSSRSGNVEIFAVGMLATGSVLVWSGTQDRRRAAQPQTTLGVTVGRTSGVILRRSW
jgi:hypothetical protein